MQIIQRMLQPCSSLPVDQQVTLEAERRNFLKRRWRGCAEDGTEFGFDLESRLTDGCVVFQQEGKDYIVRQLPETVYQIEWVDASFAALVGWKVGNLHLPAEIGNASIRVLHDEAMTQLLEREGWAFTEPSVIFSPMKAMAHAP